jgi:hypothetical protein
LPGSAISAQDAAKFGFTVLGTDGLVEIVHGGSSPTLKLTKASSSVTSIDHAHRGVEQLAALVNAIKGVDDGLGTPLSGLKDVGLLQNTFEN